MTTAEFYYCNYHFWCFHCDDIFLEAPCNWDCSYCSFYMDCYVCANRKNCPYSVFYGSINDSYASSSGGVFYGI